MNGHITADGTHTHDLLGVIATDKKVSFSEVRTVGVTNGKAAKHREVADTTGKLQQTDELPAE